MPFDTGTFNPRPTGASIPDVTLQSLASPNLLTNFSGQTLLSSTPAASEDEWYASTTSGAICYRTYFGSYKLSSWIEMIFRSVR